MKYSARATVNKRSCPSESPPPDEHPTPTPPAPLTDFAARDSNAPDQYFASNDDYEDAAAGRDPKRHCGEPAIRKAVDYGVDVDIWLPFRQEYLDELMALETHGVNSQRPRCSNANCPGARDVQGVFWCKDCFGAGVLCQVCCVGAHQAHPFHQIERWVENHWQASSLHSIGLIVFLGHGGAPCPHHTASDGTRGLVKTTVIHSNGVHSVNIHYCLCTNGAAVFHTPFYLQLLRARLYPAHTINEGNLKTCATFTVMHQIHLLDLHTQSPVMKISRYLDRLTDNTGLLSTPEHRYRLILGMLRQWRFLALHRHFGTSFNANGFHDVQDGDLALLCPCCPRPGVNLPPDWASDAVERPWLYHLGVCADANFRLKGVESTTKTRGLLTGQAYFVNEDSYRSHLGSTNSPAEKSTCSELAAVNDADTRSAKGLRSTGVGGVACLRHSYVLPNGIGDLQYGERYPNMDFVANSGVSTLVKHNGGIWPKVLDFSYDIMCQYGVNLRKRQSTLPSDIAFPALLIIRHFIPKLHLIAHKALCHVVYSLNLAWGVARSDGEGIERIWAIIGIIALSVKMMTAGARHDTIDDHIASMNYEKFTKTARFLQTKWRLAMREAAKQSIKHGKLCKKIVPSDIETWKHEVEEFRSKVEANPFGEIENNPYVTTVKTSDLVANAQAQLLKHEREANAASGGASESTTLTGTIILGLSLEESQIKLRELKRDTSIQKATLETRRLAVQKQVHSFINMRTSFGIEFDTDLDLTTPEDVPLQLPSTILSHDPEYLSSLNDASIFNDLVKAETLLRIAQAGETLGLVRRLILTRGYLNRHIAENSKSSNTLTRSRSQADLMNAKLTTAVDKYNRAWSALCVLDPHGEWEAEFEELLTPNLAPPNPEAHPHVDAQGNPAESRAPVMSWLWHNDKELGTNEAVRVEWAWSYQRSERWKEEVLLVAEEKRRFIASLKHLFTIWVARAKSPAALAHPGKQMYAYKQAFFMAARARQACEIWKDDSDSLNAWIHPEVISAIAALHHDRPANEKELQRAEVGYVGPSIEMAAEVDDDDERLDGAISDDDD